MADALARKIPHKDNLVPEGRKGVFHKAPAPAIVFASAMPEKAEGEAFAAHCGQMRRLFRRLRSTCPTLFVYQVYSSAYFVDLEAWEEGWELEPIFQMDTLYLVAKDFSFGVILDPFNRRVTMFGKALLGLLRSQKPLWPDYFKADKEFRERLLALPSY